MHDWCDRSETGKRVIVTGFGRSEGPSRVLIETGPFGNWPPECYNQLIPTMSAVDASLNPSLQHDIPTNDRKEPPHFLQTPSVCTNLRTWPWFRSIHSRVRACDSRFPLIPLRNIAMFRAFPIVAASFALLVGVSPFL